jgi:hypothetical protein
MCVKMPQPSGDEKSVRLVPSAAAQVHAVSRQRAAFLRCAAPHLIHNVVGFPQPFACAGIPRAHQLKVNRVSEK